MEELMQYTCSHKIKIKKNEGKWAGLRIEVIWKTNCCQKRQNIFGKMEGTDKM